MFAMTKPLNDLVKPELAEKWATEIYPKFFVQDANCVHQCRQPGLFKEEAAITNASMVALRRVLKL